MWAKFPRHTLVTSMKDVKANHTLGTLKGLIRSFGDLSNNWMTRTIREFQQPWKRMVIWWLVIKRLTDYLTTMEIKVHPSQYERPKRRPVRKSLGRQEPNFGQNISHLIWAENSVSLKHSWTRIIFKDLLQRDEEQNMYNFFEIFKLGRIKSEAEINLGREKDSGSCTEYC